MDLHVLLDLHLAREAQRWRDLGVIDALKRSGSLFKKAWGEQVVGKILNAAVAEKHQREYYAYGYGADEGHESEAGDGQA